MTRFTLTQKLQMMVRPLIYVVIGYGIGGPKLLGLDHNEIKVGVSYRTHLEQYFGGVISLFELGTLT